MQRKSSRNIFVEYRRSVTSVQPRVRSSSLSFGLEKVTLTSTMCPWPQQCVLGLNNVSLASTMCPWPQQCVLGLYKVAPASTMCPWPLQGVLGLNNVSLASTRWPRPHLKTSASVLYDSSVPRDGRCLDGYVASLILVTIQK